MWVALGSLALVSCLDDGNETVVLEEGKYSVAGIPSDDLADPNPEIVDPNANIPNFNYTVEQEGDYTVIRLDMTGVQNPESKEWINLIGTGGKEGSKQNIWVSVDNKPKGILVTKASDDENGASNAVDLVFLVDNSGSMSQEADAIARDITDWAQTLITSGVDVRFACVGYGGNVGANGFNYLVNNYGITGALDFTSYTSLNSYLNERSTSGTGRTKGYYGDNAASLTTTAEAYSRAGGECGAQALRFADENFAFRNGANRVYVNFTDDYNFPGNSEEISINYVADGNNWKTNQGTIHSVISNDTTNFTSETYLIREKPWKLSQFTGGTTIVAPYDFSGVTLSDLPVTGAMLNSYVIRFTNVDEFMDGQPHEVHVTIYSEDGKVRAEKVFYVVFGTK